MPVGGDMSEPVFLCESFESFIQPIHSKTLIRSGIKQVNGFIRGHCIIHSTVLFY